MLRTHSLLSRALADEIWRAPLTPVLHPSPWRIRLLGVALCVGHPLFGWAWLHAAPQPYENLTLRALMAVLALGLVPAQVTRDLNSRLGQSVFMGVCWVEFPFFFSWMYLHNGGNTVWLASLCAMILIYYHLTDWRVATAGLVSGAAVAWVLCLLQEQAPVMPEQTTLVNSVVIGFAWTCALMLGLSSANLRREQLNHTLATMGIMAHELRTPLSTATLIADALQAESTRLGNDAPGPQIGRMAGRLHSLVRNMNHQIDTQIANARLLQLPAYEEPIRASTLVIDTVTAYPYRTPRERDCVKVQVHQDFHFQGSSRLFAQVLDNLLKNALRSLAAASSRFEPGDLRVELSVDGSWGRIVVADRGTGIDPALLPRIFEAFFSSDLGTGHGLGLAFCWRVIERAGGTIHARAGLTDAAEFTIELPIIQP